MKNAFKLGVLALAVSVSFAACSGSKKTSSADSAAKADSAKMTADTAKKDTSKMAADTGKKMATDTAKKKM